MDNEGSGRSWPQRRGGCRGAFHKGIAIERDNSQLQVYRDLDWFIGTWTDEEADAFLKVIEDFEQVDEDLWQ